MKKSPDKLEQEIGDWFALVFILILAAWFALWTSTAHAQSPTVSSYTLTLKNLRPIEVNTIYAALQAIPRPNPNINVDGLLLEIKRQIQEQETAAAQATPQGTDAKP